MSELNLNPTQVLLISIVLLLVVSGSLIYYYNNKIETLNKDFTTRLLLLNKILLKT